MLSDIEFEAWAKELGLDDDARLLISSIRTSPPVRNVGSGGQNVSGKYPSKKMGVFIQFESHTVELVGAYEMEHDPTVLEYYDQPSKHRLSYNSASGRRVHADHTPDYFVIRKDSAGWEEWKTEEQLRKLSVKQPNRWIQNEDGTWSCPPGETFAKALGLYYRVRSDSEIDWTYYQNIRFIQDYLHDTEHNVERQTRSAIIHIVKEQPGIKLMKLVDQLGSPTGIDDLFYCVARGTVYVNLYSDRLWEPESVSVYQDSSIARSYSAVLSATQSVSFMQSSAITLQSGNTLLWDLTSWTIVNVVPDAVYLRRSEDGYTVNLNKESVQRLVIDGKIRVVDSTTSNEDPILESLNRASPTDIAEANRRYEIILPYLEGTAANKYPLSSTFRRYLQYYRESERVFGNGYIGLLPKQRNKGNRLRKLPNRTLELMEYFIEHAFNTPKQKSRMQAYGELLNQCEQENTTAPSYKTFCLAIKSQSTFEQTRKRQGEKAAYAHKTWYWELTRDTPRHGVRPFDICHLDHTELDILLVFSKTGKPAGRPWATYLSDAFSRRILALYITYEKPSYRSCMMVFRECVRRHARLPHTVVVDGGKEFHSLYFDKLLAMNKIEKKRRPPGQGHFGSVLERLFGTTNTDFINNLLGNTQIMKNVRQVTKAVNPKTHANWTLERFFERLCQFAYEHYDTTDHPALGQSPREAFQQGIAETGLRKMTYISYDNNFYVQTLPSTRNGTAKVEPGRGIKVNGDYYWNGLFMHGQIEGTQVQVRYDPWNMGVAFAFVQGSWVECRSQEFHRMHGLTELQKRMISEEQRKQDRNHSQYQGKRAKAKASFIQYLESEEINAQATRSEEEAQIRAKFLLPKPLTPPPTDDKPANTNVAKNKHPYQTFGEYPQ